jgi:hypothetical protein
VKLIGLVIALSCALSIIEARDQRRTIMYRKVVAAAAVVIAGTAASFTPWASSSSGTAYEPTLSPADFSTKVDNAYFPLPVGRKLVYRGTKDARTQLDVVTVTNRTKKVAEGITGRVVTDVATHAGRLLEQTEDWYAQDKKGNVWYVGEKTAAYGPNGKVDTSGSWEAGVKDAEPGIVMEATPRIPDAYRQEYLAGDAEDTAWIVQRDGSIKVPYRTFRNALVSLEAARIEPGAFDEKVYAPGIGIVYERALTGRPEIAKLVNVTG